MTRDDASERVLAIIDDDRGDLVDLCLALGNLRDYSGNERAVGEAVVEWLREADIDAWLQQIEETSVNAIGVLRGTDAERRNGHSLILNAHMDTQGIAPKGGESVERKIRGAWRDGELLYGQGLANDKAQLAAEMIAARAIRKSGIGLRADLFVTGVAQETSAPFDRDLAAWSGVGPAESQVREGFGARWLVEQGIVADYALVGEVSDFTMSVAQAGYLRLRVSVPGNVAYTPAIRRGQGIGGNPNPFERAGHVITRIETWAKAYEEQARFAFWGGTVIPKAQIYEIRSSGPAWTEQVDYCHIFLDIRLAPEAAPMEIQRLLARAIAETGLECEIQAYDFRRGFVSNGAERLIESLKGAHRAVLEEDLSFGPDRRHQHVARCQRLQRGGHPCRGLRPGHQGSHRRWRRRRPRRRGAADGDRRSGRDGQGVRADRIGDLRRSGLSGRRSIATDGGGGNFSLIPGGAAGGAFGNDFNDDLLSLGAPALRARLAPLVRFAGSKGERSDG